MIVFYLTLLPTQRDVLYKKNYSVPSHKSHDRSVCSSRHTKHLFQFINHRHTTIRQYSGFELLKVLLIMVQTAVRDLRLCQ